MTDIPIDTENTGLASPSVAPSGVFELSRRTLRSAITPSQPISRSSFRRHVDRRVNLRRCAGPRGLFWCRTDDRSAEDHHRRDARFRRAGVLIYCADYKCSHSIAALATEPKRKLKEIDECGWRRTRRLFLNAQKNGPGADGGAEAARVRTAGRGQAWGHGGQPSNAHVYGVRPLAAISLLALGGRLGTGCAVLRTASASISYSSALVFFGSRLKVVFCDSIIESMWGCRRGIKPRGSEIGNIQNSQSGRR